MMEADIAFAIFALSPLRVGGGDPEQGLAVAPARHVRVIVFALEAEEDKQLVVEVLRAGEIADAQHEMIDTDDARHGASKAGLATEVYLEQMAPLSCLPVRSLYPERMAKNEGRRRQAGPSLSRPLQPSCPW